MHSSDTRLVSDTEAVLREVFDQFQTEGDFHKGRPFGSGHIHDTYFAETEDPSGDSYIIQLVNNTVFRDVPRMQENIEIVTNHIRSKLTRIKGADIKRECLTVIQAKNGKSWLCDKNGNYWRVFLFIRDHCSYDVVDSCDKAYQGGRAVGRFQAMLQDLRGDNLHETIPWFNNVEKRIEKFIGTVGEDRVKRVSTVNEEIKFVTDRIDSLSEFLKYRRDGVIPTRITHNDPKFNNILFDKNGKSLCLIDLDTVMPGYVHYDFGDAIRTGACPASEDEPDTSKIRMDIDLFSSYAEGYLNETNSTLNMAEKEYLAFAPRLITYNQVVRFLADYIDGDIYYKIHYEDQNLQRTRSQIALVKSMEEQYGEMRRIISRMI